MNSNVSTEEETTMNDDEIESIISLDDDIVPVTEEDLDFIENLGTEGNSFEHLEVETDILSSSPQLRGDEYPDDYMGMVNRYRAYLKLTPYVDYQATYVELEDLSVKNEQTNTLQQINLQLQKLQAAKERLSEIIAQLLPSHTLMKRSVDILREAWVRFSPEKSADKRKADSIFRISELEMEYLTTDALFRTCMHISKNLDSQQEVLSRRITIFNLQLKLNDMGRNGMPDYDFNQKQDIEGTLVSSGIEEGQEVDPTQAVEADEISF